MNTPDTLLALLFDAPEMHVEAVQTAIKHVAAGDYRAAAQCLQYAADYYGTDDQYDKGQQWAARAELMAAQLRMK